MKRSRVALLAVSGALVWTPAAARADVLEITTHGAEWIAGGNPREALDASLSLANAPEVPEAAIADLADNADAVPAAYSVKVQELAARFDQRLQQVRGAQRVRCCVIGHLVH